MVTTVIDGFPVLPMVSEVAAPINGSSVAVLSPISPAPLVEPANRRRPVGLLAAAVVLAIAGGLGAVWAVNQSGAGSRLLPAADRDAADGPGRCPHDSEHGPQSAGSTNPDRDTELTVAAAMTQAVIELCDRTRPGQGRPSALTVIDGENHQ